MIEADPLLGDLRFHLQVLGHALDAAFLVGGDAGGGTGADHGAGTAGKPERDHGRGRRRKKG